MIAQLDSIPGMKRVVSTTLLCCGNQSSLMLIEQDHLCILVVLLACKDHFFVAQ